MDYSDSDIDHIIKEYLVEEKRSIMMSVKEANRLILEDSIKKYLNTCVGQMATAQNITRALSVRHFEVWNVLWNGQQSASDNPGFVRVGRDGLYWLWSNGEESAAEH